jgi:hypothetical protein
MSENVKELTPKQTQALRSLLTRPNIALAASDVGVSERTVYRWLDEPLFKQALTKAEDQALDAATRGLVSMTNQAVLVITTLMVNPATHPATRLRAAECVLSNTLKLYELRNLAARLAALESRNETN